MKQDFKHLIIMHQTIKEKLFKSKNFQRSNVQNVHIQNCTFNNCDFSRSSLTNLRISDCVFIDCKFIDADLSFCKLSNNTFKNCNFSFAEIENMNFYKINFTNTLFTGARLANNTFLETSFIEVDLNGSTTKFNCFETSLWEKSIFGNCSIDYNIAINSKFVSSKMNLETLGSTWGLQESDLKDITFLSLGRELVENRESIYANYYNYLTEKKLCLEKFTFQVSLKKENIYENFKQLLDCINERYINGQYLSPDELRYFYEILKVMRREAMLPLLILNQILSFSKELLKNFSTDDTYYETFLLFYNNICLIYNSMTHELASYRYDSLDNNCTYHVKIVFKEKPKQNVVQVFNILYQYVFNTSSSVNIQFIKDEKGSYIIWLIMPLAALAAFNIGTLLLTGGVKHLIKLRASSEVLFSKKLPRKYYLDVYEKDDSDEIAKGIISMLLSGKLSSLSQELCNLSSDGINAQNIEDISVENNHSTPA